jgi:hypothetical protein
VLVLAPGATGHAALAGCCPLVVLEPRMWFLLAGWPGLKGGGGTNRPVHGFAVMLRVLAPVSPCHV